MEMTLELRILVYAVVIIFATLAIFLVLTLKKLYAMLETTTDNIDKLSTNVTKSLDRLTDDIDDIKAKLFTSLDGVDRLTETMTDATQNMDRGLNRVFNAIEPVGKLVDSFVNKIYPPVSQFASIITASSKAVNAFLNVLGRNK